jgi:Pyruvate/2-oxoacid:ferredoxin oxidoreductase gamma subunit
MTGGQFSATTPPEAMVGSGFLNRLERPIDVAQVAVAAGAPFVARSSAYQKDLPELIEKAIRYKGFSVVDIWGVCPGRYLKRNKLTPNMIDDALNKLKPLNGPVLQNMRTEYGQSYRKHAAGQKPISPPAGIDARFDPPKPGRQEVVILGAAGQRILTAGEVLGIAGLTAGLNMTQKNEYNITVLRGPSICELILSPEEIDYTGITKPSAVIVLAPEGVLRRESLINQLDYNTVVIQAAGVAIPSTRARVISVNFKGKGIKKTDWALAALAFLSNMNHVLNSKMLDAAVKIRFKDRTLYAVKEIVAKATA